MKRNGIGQQHSFLYKINLSLILLVILKKNHTSITMSVSKEIAATIIRIVTDVQYSEQSFKNDFIIIVFFEFLLTGVCSCIGRL